MGNGRVKWSIGTYGMKRFRKDFNGVVKVLNHTFFMSDISRYVK